MEIEILGINIKILYWVFIAFYVVLIVVGARIKNIAKEFRSQDSEFDAKIGIILSVIAMMAFGPLLYFWPLQEDFSAFNARACYVFWTLGLIALSFYFLRIYKDIKQRY